MKIKIYKNEEPLFVIALVISSLIWMTLAIATLGGILLLIPIGFLIYLFAQSGFISYLKGTGALVSDKQFPDIQERVKACAQKVGLKKIPDVYILHGNGIFNAFATRFLRKSYIILLSDVLDAVEDQPEITNFYIGHEMGHIHRKHLIVEPFLELALCLPLLGAAYSRAREYTCDLYGRACCESEEAAKKGLALLAVGAKRYKTINLQEYLGQIKETSTFWMSFHELIASYPWLTKRVAHITSNTEKKRFPSRNPFAYLFAIFVPRISIISLAIIYCLILVSAGALEGNALIQELQQETGEYDESYYEDYEDFQSYTDEQKQEFLQIIANDVNQGLPDQIDEATLLTKSYVEDFNTLVYDYTLDTSHGDLNFERLKEIIYSGSHDYWCNDLEAGPYRDMGTQIIYRYHDQSDNLLDDIVLDLTACDE